MAIKWEVQVVAEKPKATVSAGAIGLNGVSVDLLNKADSVAIGFDDETRTIVVAPFSSVKQKGAISHEVKPNKNGATIRSRSYMSVIFDALNIKLENMQKVKCDVEGKDGMLVIKLP